jgi:hypothetical protein
MVGQAGYVNITEQTKIDFEKMFKITIKKYLLDKPANKMFQFIFGKPLNTEIDFEYTLDLQELKQDLVYIEKRVDIDDESFCHIMKKKNSRSKTYHFDDISNSLYCKILSNMKYLIVRFIYNNQKIFKLKSSRSLEPNILSDICVPSFWGLSRTQIQHNIQNEWIKEGIDYFIQNNQLQNTEVLEKVLEVYSLWNAKYQYPESFDFYKMHKYEYIITEGSLKFKNKLGDICTINDVLCGLLFYSQALKNDLDDVHLELYHSCFYNYILSKVFNKIIACF